MIGFLPALFVVTRRIEALKRRGEQIEQDISSKGAILQMGVAQTSCLQAGRLRYLCFVRRANLFQLS